jgi:hypothetical protein
LTDTSAFCDASAVLTWLRNGSGSARQYASSRLGASMPCAFAGTSNISRTVSFPMA